MQSKLEYSNKNHLKYSLFSNIQRRRQHVISELLSTERDYVGDLDLLIETFLNPNSITCVRLLVVLV